MVRVTFSQSGGTYNIYSTVARDLWQREPPLSSGYASDLGQFTAINPWPRAITITYIYIYLFLCLFIYLCVILRSNNSMRMLRHHVVDRLPWLELKDDKNLYRGPGACFWVTFDQSYLFFSSWSHGSGNPSPLV